MSVIRRLYNYYDWYFKGGKERHKKNAEIRKINQLHCYDFPSENNGWMKYGHTPVIGDEKTGTLFDPYVFIHDGVFFMFVSCREKGSLQVYKSADGVRWDFLSTALSRKLFTWESQVNRGCVTYVNGTWHLWYTGQHKGLSKIGHITSKDFKSFNRKKTNNPVLVPELSNEGTNVMNPCVLFDNEREVFRMWYAAGEFVEPDCIYYAESKDGDTWTKRKEPVLTKDASRIWEQFKVGGCEVKQFHKDEYIMYYIGYQNLDVARICFAISRDGINWERPKNNICLSPTKEKWDCNATYKPTVLYFKDKYYMWYNGRSSKDEFIGLAINNKQHD